MKFIKLTRYDTGESIYINTLHIIALEKSQRNSGTVIYIANSLEDYLYVTESVELIMKLINRT